VKSPKVIIPIIVVLVLVGVFFLVRQLTDHSAEFRKALYSGDIADVEQMLKAHPSLANAPHMEDPNRGGSNVGDWSPLHVAASMGNAPLVNLLARYHAKTEAKDKRGLTPLLWTAFAGRRDAAAALLSNGADINARGPDGRSTLDLAKLSLDTNMIELLRERGAKE
jgi:ankyrin repeat protein